jgi:hypothetical protein
MTNNVSDANCALPTDGDVVSGGDDRIRETRKMIQEGLGSEHHIYDAASGGAKIDSTNDTVAANQGFHRQGSAIAFYGSADHATTGPDGTAFGTASATNVNNGRLAVIRTGATHHELRMYTEDGWCSDDWRSTDFTISRAQAAGSVIGSIINTSATAASQAYLAVSATAATDGDAYIRVAQLGVQAFHMGWDASAVKFVIGSGNTPGTNDFFSIDNGGNVYVIGGDFYTTRSQAGVTVTGIIRNEETANAASSARLLIKSSGASSGDAFLTFDNNVITFSMGVDNSDSDKFKISYGVVLGGTDYLTIDTEGNVAITTGKFNPLYSTWLASNTQAQLFTYLSTRCPTLDTFYWASGDSASKDIRKVYRESSPGNTFDIVFTDGSMLAAVQGSATTLGLAFELWI